MRNPNLLESGRPKAAKNGLIPKFFISSKNDLTFLIPIIIFSLLTLLFFYRVLKSGRVLQGLDFLLSYNIFIKFTLDYFSQHQTIPFWLPYIYSGMPVVECLLTPFFYPTFWLLFFLPFALAINLQYLIHIFFAGYFTYIFARELGVNHPGALFSGIAFMFSGSVLTILAAGHYMKVYTYGLYPLLFLLVYKGLISRRLFYFLTAAGVMGLMLLSMHMQVIYYGLMLLSFFIAYWLVNDFRREKNFSWLIKGTGFYLIMVLLGLGIGMAQFYPALKYMDFSTRQEGVSYEDATSWSYPPEEIIGLFAPGFAGEKMKYFGRILFMDRNHYTSILPFILALMAVLFVRRSEVYFFSFGALFILSIALGRHTPLYWLYYHLIPGINKFRLPMSSMYLFAFFQALLAGLGLEWLSSQEKKFYLKTVVLVWGAMMVALLAALAIYLFREPLGSHLLKLASFDSSMKSKWLNQLMAWQNLQFTIKALLYLGATLLLSGGLFFLGSRSFPTRWQWFSSLLLILLGLDLFLINSRYIQPAFSDKQYYHEGFIWKYIKKDDDLFRVHRIGPHSLPRWLGAGNVAAYHKIYSTNGNYQNPIARYNDLFKVLNKNINFLALCNVKYIISAKKLNQKHPYLSPLPNPDQEVYFYKNQAFLPRFYLTYDYQVVDDPQQIIQQIAALAPKMLTKTVYLERDPKFLPMSPPPQAVESIVLTQYDANQIKLEVKQATPGFLVMSEVYYPAWEAEVDGKPVEILRANYFMRTLPLSAGNHKVVMRYRPHIIKKGLIVTFISIFLCLLGLFLTRKLSTDEKRLLVVPGSSEV